MQNRKNKVQQTNTGLVQQTDSAKLQSPAGLVQGLVNLGQSRVIKLIQKRQLTIRQIQKSHEPAPRAEQPAIEKELSEKQRLQFLKKIRRQRQRHKLAIIEQTIRHSQAEQLVAQRQLMKVKQKRQQAELQVRQHYMKMADQRLLESRRRQLANQQSNRQISQLSAMKTVEQRKEQQRIRKQVDQKQRIRSRIQRSRQQKRLQMSSVSRHQSEYVSARLKIDEQRTERIKKVRSSSESALKYLRREVRKAESLEQREQEARAKRLSLLSKGIQRINQSMRLSPKVVPQVADKTKTNRQDPKRIGKAYLKQLRMMNSSGEYQSARRTQRRQKEESLLLSSSGVQLGRRTRLSGEYLQQIRLKLGQLKE